MTQQRWVAWLTMSQQPTVTEGGVWGVVLLLVIWCHGHYSSDPQQRENITDLRKRQGGERNGLDLHSREVQSGFKLQGQRGQTSIQGFQDDNLNNPAVRQ